MIVGHFELIYPFFSFSFFHLHVVMFAWFVGNDLDVGARTGLGLAGPGVSATLPRGIGMANGTQPVMGFGK